MKKRSICIGLVVLVGILGIYFGLPAYFYDAGVKSFNAKQYKAALSNFQNARIWNKDNTNYNLYYAKTLAKFRPTYNIQKEMCNLAASSKKDSAQKFAFNTIAVWRANVIKSYGTNYIDQAPMNSDIIRWNPKTFPLKVYVDYTNNNRYPDYYNVVITRAFDKWHTSIDFISFVFTTSEKNADIVIELKGTPETGCNEANCKYVLAHTDPVIKDRILKQMIITIYDRDAHGAFFSDKELYNTVLHEIGHALGIMGHSYSTADLMYMQNEVTSSTNTMFIQSQGNFQFISASDIATMRLLYNIVPTVTNTKISEINTKNLVYPEILLGTMKVRGNEKLKEAKNYIKNAPDLPAGYIDMALAYDDLGDFKKASSALEEALVRAKTPEDEYIVYYNMAVLHLNNDDATVALQYAQQAQNIKSDEEIRDLIGNIEHAINTNSKPFWSGLTKK